MDKENNLKNINRNLSKSERSKRRKAAKERIVNAYSENSNVEVIPAKRDIIPAVPEKLRVAAYCRVSTDNEAQAGSYQLQIQYYTEYIQKNPNWIFVGVYADVDTPYGHNAKAHEQPIFALVHGLVVL